MKILTAFAGFCLLWAQATGQTLTPPVIDGTIDAVWSTTPQLDAAKTVMNQGVTNAADFSGFSRVLWDNTAIYLLAVVNDDILVNNMPTSSDNDCVEFYLDLDNSKNACDGCSWPAHSYDPNDFQFRFVWGKDGVAAYKHYLVKGGELDAGFDLDGIQSAQNRTATPGTWVMEVKIPWSNLLFAPVAVNGKTGFDFEMIDNDGTARDARFGWNHTADNAWQTPSIFGTLKMLANGAIEIANDLVPPPAPVVTAAADPNGPNINLSWNAVTDDQGTVVRYDIYNGLKLFVASTTNLTYMVTGLQWSTDYTYYLKAIDNSQNHSDFSNPATARVIDMPTDDKVPPTNPVVSAKQVKNWVQLTWTASTDNLGVEGYKVYETLTANVALKTLPANQLFYLADRKGGADLAENTAYTFYVAAFDKAGNESVRVPGTATTGVKGLIYKTKYIAAPNVTIDGLSDDAVWGSLDKALIDKVHQGTAVDPTDLSGFFKAFADLNNLYLYIEINDESLNAWDGISGYPNPNYMYDAIEVFFSMTNAYNHNPLKAGDSQLRFNYDVSDQITGQWGTPTGQVQLGPKDSKKDADLNITFAQALFPDNSGYSFEAKIPLNKLADLAGGFIPYSGARIGFDVNYLDNDGTVDANNNAARQNVYAWGNTSGIDTWNNTANLATMEFTGGPSGIAQIKQAAFEVYPNPVTNMLTVTLTDITRVEIFNLTGAMVYQEKAITRDRMMIDLSGLSQGTYLLKVFNHEGISGNQLIIKE